MNSILSLENLTALGWLPLLVPHFVRYFSEKKKPGMYVSLFFGVFSWIWVSISSSAAMALFGLSFLVLSSVAYLITNPNRKDFVVVSAQLFWVLFTGTLISVGGFANHEFSWSGWVSKFDANRLLHVTFLVSSIFLLLGRTESEEEYKGERFSLLYFWPQAVSLQFLSKVSVQLNGAWAVFVVSALYGVWALANQPGANRRRKTQNAIYIFALACTLAGLSVHGQLFFLALSLPNLFLSDFDLSQKNRWPFVALLTASLGFIGFVGGGVMIRAIGELWTRPLDLVPLSVAFTIIGAQLWSEFFKMTEAADQSKNRNNALIVFIFLAMAVQLGVFLVGSWSGRFLQGDPDIVWQGVLPHLNELGEYWNESLGIWALQFVLAIGVGFVLKKKGFTFSVPVFEFAKLRKGAQSFFLSLENQLVVVENLDEGFAKFGVVPGRILQLVYNGNILRGLLIWVVGLIFLFLHYYRA